MANERDIDTTLTSAGRVRRERMRDELLIEMRSLHHRRTRRRHTLAASLIAVLIGSAWLMYRTPHQPPAGSQQQLAHEPPEQAVSIEQTDASPEFRVEFVDATAPSRTVRIETDATILDRYRLRDEPLRFVTHLTDEQLVRELAAIGEPASIVHLPDRTFLVRTEPNEPMRLKRDG